MWRVFSGKAIRGGGVDIPTHFAMGRLPYLYLYLYLYIYLYIYISTSRGSAYMNSELNLIFRSNSKSGRSISKSGIHKSKKI